MDKVYEVISGDPFGKISERFKYFSTEDKARAFIVNDCERVMSAYNLSGKGYWDEGLAEYGCHYYKCGNIEYRYIEREVL